MREKGFRLRLVGRHQSARRKPSGRSPMDRSTEIELLEELAGLRGSRSFHLDDAIATSPVARYTCPERFSRERQMLFRASSTATTRGAYTSPSAISAPTTSRRNSPASRSNRPPETVRPQGPTSVMGRFPSSSIFNRSLSRQSVVFLAWCRGSFSLAVRRRVRRGGGCPRQVQFGRPHRSRACSTSCVLRRVLASVRGQRIGCQRHAQSKSVPECLSPSRARTRHVGSANEWAHVHHRGPRPGEGTLVVHPPSGAALSSSPR